MHIFVNVKRILFYQNQVLFKRVFACIRNLSLGVPEIIISVDTLAFTIITS